MQNQIATVNHVEIVTKTVRICAPPSATISANRLEVKNRMASNSGSNQINVPQARNALNNMKYEIARELGVNLKQGYNGDLTSREAGYVGGYMVKRLIEQAENQMAGQG